MVHNSLGLGKSYCLNEKNYSCDPITGIKALLDRLEFFHMFKFPSSEFLRVIFFKDVLQFLFDCFHSCFIGLSVIVWCCIDFQHKINHFYSNRRLFIDKCGKQIKIQSSTSYLFILRSLLWIGYIGIQHRLIRELDFWGIIFVKSW